MADVAERGSTESLGAVCSEIHQQVHALMASGARPLTVELGWQEYGLLARMSADGPDPARPRAIFDLPIRLLPRPSLLRVRSG